MWAVVVGRIAAPTNPYRAWIDTYADEGFGEAVRTVIAITDRAATAATPAMRSQNAQGIQPIKPVRMALLGWCLPAARVAGVCLTGASEARLDNSAPSEANANKILGLAPVMTSAIR